MIQRCVDGANYVTYCFCCTWMFIYAGIRHMYVRMIFIVSDPLTDLSRSWSSRLQCGGNMRIAQPLSLHYSIACLDECKSWFSSTRPIVLSVEGLACAIKCFTHLKTDPPSSTQMVGSYVKSVECK